MRDMLSGWGCTFGCSLAQLHGSHLVLAATMLPLVTTATPLYYTHCDTLTLTWYSAKSLQEQTCRHW